MSEEQRKKHGESLKGRKLTYKSEESRLSALSNLTKDTPWNSGTRKIYSYICKTCNETFCSQQHNRKFCSVKCSSIQTKGESNWRWIKDRSKVKLDTERGGPLHKTWSKEVKNRDGWKCKVANSDCLGRMESHHILSWKDHPELRYNLNNGITLCHYHHPRKREDEERLTPTYRKLIDDYTKVKG